ncbi:polar amino acid transport system substrate-binding protein [uncultured Thiomicrorhabdus sp.]
MQLAPFPPIFLYLSLCFSVLFSASILAEESPVSKNSALVPVSVQLSWQHQFEFAGFYAAIQQGYYRQAGLDVTLKAWQPGILATDEVLAKRADFGVGYSSVVIDAAKGKPLDLVMASFQYSPMILLSHTPVEHLQQLSGAKVMHYGDVLIKTFIKRINEVAHLPVKMLSPTGNLQDFIDKKVDLYAAFQTNEPYRLRQKGVEFYEIDPKSFGIQSYSDILVTHHDFAANHSQIVAAMREATILGWQYALQHPVAVVDYILEHYPVNKDRQALLAEAEMTKRFVKLENIAIGNLNPLKIMAQALEAQQHGFISKQQLQDFDAHKVIFESHNLYLTDAESKFLRENPVIKVGVDPSWEPFEYIDDKGKWHGISADYFQLMGQRLGVVFEPSRAATWNQVLMDAQSGETQVLSCAVASPERQKFMNFTAPYLSFPMVLVAEQSVSYVEDYHLLKGKTIAVPKGYWAQEWLETNYPEINTLPVASVTEGLYAVMHKKAFAFSGNLASINFAIKREGLNGLRVVGDSGIRFDLAIGTTDKEPELLSIMQKALASIDETQRNNIYKKWFQLEVLNTTDHGTLIKVILASILIASVLLWLSWWFYQQKRRQSLYINRINELSFATYTDASGAIQWASDSFMALVGCKKSDVIGQLHQKFIHPEQDPELYEKVFATILQGKTFSGEVRSIGCNGKDSWVAITMVPEFKYGKVVGVWTTRVDITDKVKLKEVAIRDALTGLYNRRQLNELFEPLLHKAERNKSPFAIAMFDIDYFKRINDQYGHQQGDEVLVQVAGLATRHFCRANDMLFRVGGEEFVLIGDYESEQAFLKHLEQFRAVVAGLNIENVMSPYKVMTVSIGALYCYKVSEVDTNYTYSVIDRLLYQAKQEGRNRIVSEQQC